MTLIPAAIQAISRASSDPNELRRILIAAVLQFQERDEDIPFVLSEENLRNAHRYMLIVNDMSDEGAIVLSVRHK